ncbi:hypothetical protein AB4Y85_13335 [Microvirga sp. 2YAF29]|uniref:hypothetical protein n=1 Tax=Microvirga sp. 2YAF29 TaxID=3233031 RepID=UPI003F98BA6E
MRIQVIVPALALAALALGGCSTSPSAEGVLPRTDVPPPPSIERSAPSRPSGANTTGTAVQQRRGLSVPDRLVPPRPSATR